MHAAATAYETFLGARPHKHSQKIEACGRPALLISRGLSRCLQTDCDPCSSSAAASLAFSTSPQLPFRPLLLLFLVVRSQPAQLASCRSVPLASSTVGLCVAANEASIGPGATGAVSSRACKFCCERRRGHVRPWSAKREWLVQLTRVLRICSGALQQECWNVLSDADVRTTA